MKGEGGGGEGGGGGGHGTKHGQLGEIALLHQRQMLCMIRWVEGKKGFSSLTRSSNKKYIGLLTL